MIQSDDTLARDTSYEFKSPEDELYATIQSLSRESSQNGNNRDSENFETSNNTREFEDPIERLPGPDSRGMSEMTDGASGGHSGSSCGLVGSLFPNSCRGRAESFARRLHRRLTSLGGETGESDTNDETKVRARGGLLDKATETSWRKHEPTGQRTMTSGSSSNSATSLLSLKTDERVLDSQPQHSPESDIYYDFDLEPGNYHETPDDGTDSPNEMANPAELINILVNHRNLHESCKCSQEGPRPPGLCQDQESGCVFSSPLAGTSPETENSSDTFYDPESSETEKSNRSDNFQDPQSASSSASEANCVFSNGIGIRKVSVRQRISGDSKRHIDDPSESSSSSCNPSSGGTLENSRERKIVGRESSEDSVNGKSSLETTSPSHESLWSTFDDSTVSLEDEATSSLLAASLISVGIQKTTILTKSHSDSEIIGKRAQTRLLTNAGDDISEETGTKVEQVESTYSSNFHIPGASLVLECPTGRRIAGLEENLKNQVNLRIDDEADTREEGMSRLLERLACSPNVDKIDMENGLNEAKQTNGRKAPLAEDEQEEDEEEEEEEEHENEKTTDDQEEMEEIPQRVRRCSSLKTGKTPPGTPGRKKIVRFADVLGLDLADVRTFLDEIPKIPNSAYSDLIYDEAFQKDSSPVNFWGTGPATFTTPLYAATMPRGLMNGIKLDRTLVPLFQQPGGLPNFLDLVRERQVCLENVIVHDPINICLQGTVRVRNLDFHKSVHVRYSLDSWRNFSDLQAIYAPNSCDGFSDKFTFVLYCHTLKVGQRLELAVRFQCKGVQYWDNNAGANYCFQCLPATPSSSPYYLPITSPTVVTTGENSTTIPANPHDWSPTFY